VRLGRARRGAALVTETMNSNTINLVGGLAIPALFVSLGALSTLGAVDLGLLLATTVAAIVLLARPAGMRRSGGVVLIAAWLVFAVVQLVR